MSSYTGTVLITGGTQGMGYHCALQIARQLPTHLVIIASRTDPNSAADTINRATKQSNVRYMQLNLSKLQNVREFAQSWTKAGYPPINALILNAAIQYPDALRYSDDGVELTFAVNHLGHALLFHLLCPYLAEDARMVVVSSGTHDPAKKSGLPDAAYTSAQELAHPTDKTKHNPGRQRYSTSKLVNVLWTYALARRLNSSPHAGTKTIIAMDPGLMPGTGLARNAGPVLKWIWHHVMPRILPLLRLVVDPNIHSPEESGKSLAWLALGDEVKGKSGKYFKGRKEIPSSTQSHDEAKQGELWDWTVNFLSHNQEEKQRFENLM